MIIHHRTRLLQRGLLLALQTMRPFEDELSEQASKVLLQVRERRGPFPGLRLQQAGKREPGRAQSVSNPALSNTDYEETRVFIPVRIGGHTLHALVDPGSVCSYVNTKTATLYLRHDWDRQKGNTIALMAVGMETLLGEHLSGRMRIITSWPLWV